MPAAWEWLQLQGPDADGVAVSNAGANTIPPAKQRKKLLSISRSGKTLQIVLFGSGFAAAR